MKNRLITIILALGAACAFALSVQMGRWWALGDVEIGPFGSRHCFDGQCRSAGLEWTDGSARWIRTGVATWAAGLLAMLTLAGLAAGLAAKRVPRLVAKMVLVTILTGTLTAIGFIAQFPGLPGASISRGVWLFAAAVLLAATSAVLVLRAERA